MKNTFYIYKSGKLIRKDDSIALIEKNGNVSYIPIIQTNCIICFGDIETNKRVFQLLNRYQIILIFFNYYGQYIGRFTPKRYIDGKILIEQVDAYKNNRITIAHKLIKSELKNTLSVLKYYQKKIHSLNKEIEEIILIINLLKDVSTVEEMMLLEARSKKIYYSTFDTIIRNKEFIFSKRSIHPATNEVNSMLSYGYALLYSDVLADLDKSSLMPQISFIHSLSKSTDALQYDIADMLKPIIIDRLVLRIINKRQIKLKHFTYNDDICMLNKEGIKIFLYEYDELMRKSIKIGNKYYSYRNIITREIYKLSQFIKDESKGYHPYIMEW